jgi:hypothetical protein
MVSWSFPQFASIWLVWTSSSHLSSDLIISRDILVIHFDDDYMLRKKLEALVPEKWHIFAQHESSVVCSDSPSQLVYSCIWSLRDGKLAEPLTNTWRLSEKVRSAIHKCCCGCHRKCVSATNIEGKTQWSHIEIDHIIQRRDNHRIQQLTWGIQFKGDSRYWQHSWLIRFRSWSKSPILSFSITMPATVAVLSRSQINCVRYWQQSILIHLIWILIYGIQWISSPIVSRAAWTALGFFDVARPESAFFCRNGKIGLRREHLA